jgi:hypothetical protein
MPLVGRYYARCLNGGAKSCLLPVGAMHGGSYKGLKSCLLLLDQRWCDSDGRQDGMGRLHLPVSPPLVSGC